jgi:D-3-phosphoglycerate dehydrogenase
VALRLKPFHCRIVVADPKVPPAQIKKEGFTPVSMDELFSQSDLVTLHCPSTAETRQMVNARTLGLMKRGSLLVNVSRGTLVNTDDMVAALKSGVLAGAAMDVVDPEPIPADHPLLKMDNVLVNPHCASGSVAAGQKLRTDVADIVNGVKA